MAVQADLSSLLFKSIFSVDINVVVVRRTKDVANDPRENRKREKRWCAEFSFSLGERERDARNKRLN